MEVLLTTWLAEDVLTKVSDGAIARVGIGKRDSLERRIREAARKWQETLPKGLVEVTDAVVPLEWSDSGGDRPALSSLDNSFRDGLIPPENAWLSALLEQWHIVRARHGNQTQPFFQLPEDEARAHLTRLARAVYRACSQDPALFQSTAIETMTGMDAKLNTLLEKFNAATERSNAERHARSIKLLIEAQQLQIRCVGLVQQGNLDQAFQELRQGMDTLTGLLDENPADLRVLNLVGFTLKTFGQLFDRTGTREASAHFYGLAERVFQVITLQSAEDRANAEKGLGNIYLERGQITQAIDKLRRAAELNAADVYAWHDLFLAYDMLGRQGRVEIEPMREALAQLKTLGHDAIGIGEQRIRQFKDVLHAWEAAQEKPISSREASLDPSDETSMAPR